MVNLRGTRRFRLAVELLCEKAGITDKELDEFIIKKKKAHSQTAKKEDAALNAKDTAALIGSIDDLEELKQFDSDERKTVLDALAKRREELNVE